jgi:hypothetical protein
MPIEIVPYSADLRGAVREFNGRLSAQGTDAEMRLPEDPETEMLPGSHTYVAVDSSVVRGGYTLRPQRFSFRGAMRCVAHYRLPISEGIIDKRHALLGALLLRDALRKEPLLYALGMGGPHHTLPRMLQAAGWGLSPVPFYFRVAHPARFLRQIRVGRDSRWRAALMTLAASSGVGSAGFHLLQRWRTRSGPVQFREFSDFEIWANEIWETSHRAYGLIGLRNQEALRQIYPASSTRFLRIQTAAGWAVLVDTQMRGDQYFGDLRVGTIVDCLASPQDAATVIRTARIYLEQRGVDLIISNQGHPAWAEALRADGFFGGPSNFLFAASPALRAIGASDWHINRGDGDGPVHL